MGLRAKHMLLKEANRKLSTHRQWLNATQRIRSNKADDRHENATLWQAKARHLGSFDASRGVNTPRCHVRGRSSTRKRARGQGPGGSSEDRRGASISLAAAWISRLPNAGAMELLEITFYIVMGVAGISIVACVWEVMRWR
jgi:hypothetical protein